MPPKGGASATLHPALSRAWEEAAACLKRGGTYVLRTSPAGTVLMPVPAWKLRNMSAKEMLELTGAAEAGADAGAGCADDAANDDIRIRRAAARRRRRQAKRARKRAAAQEQQHSGAAHALTPARANAPGSEEDVDSHSDDSMDADGRPNEADIGGRSDAEATRGAASKEAAASVLSMDDAVPTKRPANGEGDAADAAVADADDPALIMQVDAALNAAKEQAAKRLREASAAIHKIPFRRNRESVGKQ